MAHNLQQWLDQHNIRALLQDEELLHGHLQTLSDDEQVDGG